VPNTTRFAAKAQWVEWVSVVLAVVAASTPVLAVMKAPILAIYLAACLAAAAGEAVKTKVVVAHRNAEPISRQLFG
jgi:3'-phosphoadenosine 5'-phosphosulfate (PAPS) 3'-phosphatase